MIKEQKKVTRIEQWNLFPYIFCCCFYITSSAKMLLLLGLNYSVCFSESSICFIIFPFYSIFIHLRVYLTVHKMKAHFVTLLQKFKICREFSFLFFYCFSVKWRHFVSDYLCQIVLVERHKNTSNTNIFLWNVLERLIVLNINELNE